MPQVAHPRDRIFTTGVLVPRALPEVFAFFADAKNLERITPPFLNFKISSQSTPTIQSGTVFDYKLKVRGIPLHWRSRIEEWVPNKQFVDTQLIGPYQKWYHVHRFEDRGGATWMEDHVTYRLPLGILGDFFAGWFIDRDVKMIFDYRSKVISEIFKA